MEIIKEVRATYLPYFTPEQHLIRKGYHTTNLIEFEKDFERFVITGKRYETFWDQEGGYKEFVFIQISRIP